MKILLAFLLAVFVTATLSSSNRRPRAVPLLVACLFVAAYLASFRSVG